MAIVDLNKLMDDETDADAKESLAGLAGLDMDSVEEVRFETLPIGTYSMEVKETEVAIVGDDKIPVVRLVMEILAVDEIVTLPAGKELTDFVGKKHNESFFLKDPDSVGRMKAYLSDLGVDSTGKKVPEAINSAIGLRATGKITHGKNKNNPDQPYVNFRLPKKEKPTA